MIQVVALRHVFSGRGEPVVALDGLDLEIARGELICVRGPSGSGKTTLLFAIGGMQRPSSGTVRVADTDVYALDFARRAAFRARHVGFVFQTFHLVPYLDAADNVRLACDPDGRPPGRSEAEEALARVGLADRARHRPSELSAGEQQRTAIARALVSRPAVLLADEPTGNLDEANAAGVLDLFETFRDEGGTVVMVTHGRAADARADRVLSLVDGCLVEPGIETR